MGMGIEVKDENHQSPSGVRYQTCLVNQRNPYFEYNNLSKGSKQMKFTKLPFEETNNSIISKTRLSLRHCSYCPAHRSENRGKIDNCWKSHRKMRWRRIKWMSGLVVSLAEIVPGQKNKEDVQVVV